MAAEGIQAGAAIIQNVLTGGLPLWTASNKMEDIHLRFEKTMMTLIAVREDLQKRSGRYETPNKETMADWFDKVKVVENEVKELETSFLKEKEKSIFSLISRSELSRKMEMKLSELTDLIAQGTQLWDTLVNRKAVPVVKLPAPNITYIPTLKGTLDKILLDLKDNEIRAIRLLGMVGVGKTTIMQNLNNHPDIARMFEMVIWMTVSTEQNKNKNLSIDTLQQVLVKRLKLDMEGTDDVSEVACRIKEELEGMRYLILLDDVKANLNLEEIGIPTNSNGSKIVFSTKFRHVRPFLCSNIPVKKLFPEESFLMFKKMLTLTNDHILEQRNIANLARQVVEWCDGLPLVIEMAAKIFQMRKTEQSWSDGLHKLRKWAEKGDGYMKPMEDLLNFCCENLEDAQRLCFLYSALYLEDCEISVDCLFDCWAAQEFLRCGADAEDVGVALRDILEHLIKVSLLEEGLSRQWVTMHKVIRAVALKILFKDGPFKCLVTNEASQDLQQSDCWNDKNWISLANNALQTLPDNLNCSNLSTLLLRRNSKLTELPDALFDSMENLLILDLYRTGITSLPSSVCKLMMLKVLYLNDCATLKELPSDVTKLECLQVLDIRGIAVTGIPPQIKRLTRLRRLLVSFNSSQNGEDNEENWTISELSALKELIINVKSELGVDRSSDMQWCNQMIECVIRRINTLPELTTLQFCFKKDVVDVIEVVGNNLKIFVPKEDNLRSFLVKRQDLDHFKSLQVYIDHRISPGPEYDSFVIYCNGIVGSSMIEDVLARVDALVLVNHNFIEHVSDFDSKCMNHIQGCIIQSCRKIKTVVQCGILSRLKTLVLRECPKLNVIFSDAVFHNLLEIEHLEIEDCPAIEEIIMASNNVDRNVLPNLTTLILLNMANVKRICPILEWPSLETLMINHCPLLEELPFDQNNAQKLKTIEAEKNWWETLQWPDPQIKIRLLPYCSLW